MPQAIRLLFPQIVIIIFWWIILVNDALNPVSSRGMPILAHNEKIIFFKKQVITIYEKLYFIKLYYLLKIKFLSDIMDEIIYTDSK